MVGAVATRRRRVLRILGWVAATVVVAAIVFVIGWVLPIATGYSAKAACSSVFLSGFDEARVEAEDLAAIPVGSFSVDREAKEVTASVWGLASRTAVFREGLGCALAIDVAPEDLRAQGFAPPRAAASDAPWPAGEGKDSRPDPVGLDRAALDAAVAEAFAEPDPDSLRLTRAVVVVHGGRIVAERYAEGIDRDTPLLGWSMTKSVTSALVGILVARGELDVHAPAPIEAWGGDARREITLDHLLRMSSGLAFEEVYGLLSDATHMLFEVDDAAAVAIAQPVAKAPDAEFSYSSGTTNIISAIVRSRFDAARDYHRFPHEALFVPLGMRSAVMETDGSGTFVGSSFMYATARDWARFGLLYLHDGSWGGTQILPEGWVRYTATPTPPAKLGEYGAQWWLNAGAADEPERRKLPHVPPDALWASGFQGQTVLVVPSRDAVIVRLGMTHERAAFSRDAFAGAVLEALPPAPAP